MKKNFILFIIFIISYNSTYAEDIRGRVICNGRGVSGVVVTDGVKCSQTDSKGRYSISTSEGSSFVYISTPPSYLPERENSIPIFYQRIVENKKKYDFILTKNPKNDINHTFMLHADAQLFSENNLTPYNQIIDDCILLVADQSDYDVFGIDCGDMVADKIELYPPYIQSLDRIDVPFYRTLGNHDMTLHGRSHETSYSTFESIFGPTYYSFNRGKAHYIVLNNVFYLGHDYRYEGYLTERIFSWMEEDLSFLPKGSLVFVVMHIPSEKMVNSPSLHRLLENYNVHILSGHKHYNKNVIHTENVYEHITSAVCGAWWQGGFALDGTPNGYGVYQVRGDSLSWFYKSAGYEQDYQMAVYPIEASKEFPAEVLVNVWNWDKDWTVEWFENGENKGSLKRVEAMDINVERMCSDKEKLEFKWISPMKSDHMFVTESVDSSAIIKVRVKDRFGRVFEKEVK